MKSYIKAKEGTDAFTLCIEVTNIQELAILMAFANASRHFKRFLASNIFIGLKEALLKYNDLTSDNLFKVLYNQCKRMNIHNNINPKMETNTDLWIKKYLVPIKKEYTELDNAIDRDAQFLKTQETTTSKQQRKSYTLETFRIKPNAIRYIVNNNEHTPIKYESVDNNDSTECENESFIEEEI